MSQPSFEFNPDQPDGDGGYVELVSLRSAAAKCGVSASTMKRRITNGRIPEARLTTSPKGRQQWGIPADDLRAIARREGWKLNRYESEFEALTPEEAKDTLETLRKALRRAERLLVEEQYRTSRLRRQLNDERVLLARSDAERRREEANRVLVARRNQGLEQTCNTLGLRLQQLGDTTTYHQHTGRHPKQPRP